MATWIFVRKNQKILGKIKKFFVIVKYKKGFVGLFLRILPFE